MEISASQVDNSVIINIKGEIDLHTVDQFKQKLDKQIAKGHKNLILNLEQVDFIDSSGIGAILSKYKQLNKQKGKLVMVNVRPKIRRIFEVSGILRIIDIYSSETEAVENILGGTAHE